jgi:hypothetical protein
VTATTALRESIAAHAFKVLTAVTLTHLARYHPEASSPASATKAMRVMGRRHADPFVLATVGATAHVQRPIPALVTSALAATSATPTAAAMATARARRGKAFVTRASTTPLGYFAIAAPTATSVTPRLAYQTPASLALAISMETAIQPRVHASAIQPRRGRAANSAAQAFTATPGTASLALRCVVRTEPAWP